MTYEALGMYFTFRRDLAQAIAAFQKGIALNRNHMHFYDGLARASLENRRKRLSMRSKPCPSIRAGHKLRLR